MYHVAVDNRVPYWVYSNRQDNGTMRGPSDGVERGTPVPNAGNRDLPYGMSPDGIREWDHGIGGCESGFTLPSRLDPDVIFATCYGNTVTRYEHRRRWRRHRPCCWPG